MSLEAPAAAPVPAPEAAALPVRVLAVVNDLFFEAKIGEVLRTLGAPALFAKSEAGLARRLGECRPALALVDMGAKGLDGEAAVRAIRAAHPAAWVTAFVSHVDADAKARALAAGADDAWAKSRLARELPDLVRARALGAPVEVASAPLDAAIVNPALRPGP